MSFLSHAAAAFLAGTALAIDNGKGLTPPMGWRSWNLYGKDVDQALIMNIMKGMTSRTRSVDGVPTSLCDLGYCDVGLDDNWQECGGYGADNYTYHSEAGFPEVNRQRFSDFEAMTNYAHSLNLTAGWYLNNCICKDHCGNGQDAGETNAKCYNGDAAALLAFGFDSVKLDGCGAQRDLGLWADLFNKSGKAIMMENCHWGETVPTETYCPWNFFRTSGDIRASYASVVANLQTTIQWTTSGLSRPGCWAYPDMLEVGCQHGPGGPKDPGLSLTEARTHFAAWCIVSSPLTLSHDVNNDTVSDLIWPIISNRRAIGVNQAWFGHAGSPFDESEDLLSFKHPIELSDVTVASSQFFYKPMSSDGSRTAVLLINHHDSDAANLTLEFSKIPGASCTTCHVTCVWMGHDMGAFEGNITAENVEPHGSRFWIISQE